METLIFIIIALIAITGILGYSSVYHSPPDNVKIEIGPFGCLESDTTVSDWEAKQRLFQDAGIAYGDKRCEG